MCRVEGQRERGEEIIHRKKGGAWLFWRRRPEPVLRVPGSLSPRVILLCYALLKERWAFGFLSSPAAGSSINAFTPG